jgi:hypothetical protein
MNASCGELIHKKIDPIIDFFGLTSQPAYGWRQPF